MKIITNSYEKEKLMNDKKEISLEEIYQNNKDEKKPLSDETEEMLAISRILAKLDD
jgi:hypothetical protein